MHSALRLPLVLCLYTKPQALREFCCFQFLQSLQTGFCFPFFVCSSQHSQLPHLSVSVNEFPLDGRGCDVRAVIGGTLISEIHPGGLCPASSVSVQTLNFLTKTTRITAQPFAISGSLPSMLLLFFYPSPFPPHHYNFYNTHSTLCECLHPRHKVIIDTEMPLSRSDDEQCDTHAHIHASLAIIVCTFHRVCETINKWRSDYEYDAQMLFWCHFEKWNQWEPWQTR